MLDGVGPSRDNAAIHLNGIARIGHRLGRDWRFELVMDSYVGMVYVRLAIAGAMQSKSLILDCVLGRM